MTERLGTLTFVGRRRELGELSANLSQAIAGRGRLVMVGGEPGVGKSHLLDEVACIAGERGMTTAMASCRDGEGVPPLWPWLLVVRSLLDADAIVDAELPGLLQDGQPMRGLLGDLDPAGARFRLFDRIASSLGDAARKRPLLVVLDDLQWADRSSLSLLAHLSATLRSVPLMVVGAYRDTESGPDLDEVLASLPSDTERFTLTGLSSPEVGELARLLSERSVDAFLVDTLTDHTAGNPLFVRELVRLLESQRELGRPATMPVGVRDVLDRRLASLSDECRTTLAAAAVIGREFDTELLAAVSDREPSGVADALDEAVGSRIVAETGLDRFGFVHDLFRQALYEGLGRTRRLRLHLAVGEAIERGSAAKVDGHLAELAHHFTAAAAIGDPNKAVAYGRRAAARAAGMLAFEEAADYLDRALDVLPRGDAAERARLLVALGDAHWRARDLAEARAVLSEAMDLARATDDAETFAAAALAYGGGLGGYQPLAPANTELIALLEEALARLPPDDGEQRCRILSRLAIELYLTDEVARRSDLSAEALAMARRLDCPSCLATTLYARQIAVLGPDSCDERLSAAEEILALANEVGDPELVLWGHLFRQWAHMERCEPTDDDLATCARLADQLALPGYRAEVAMRQAVNALVAGRFDESERLQKVVREGEATDLAAPSTRAALLALEFALKGPYDELAEMVAAYIADQPEKVMWRAALCTVYVELDRLDETRREFDLLAERDFDLPRDGLWLVGMYCLGFACFALGDATRAELLYPIVRPHADRAPIGAFGSMATTLGLLDATRGRFDDALAWLDLGHQRDLAIENLAYAAFTRRETAAVLLRRDGPGDRDAARAVLGDVVKDLRGFGFDGLVGRAERLLDAAEEGGAVVEHYELCREGKSWTVTFEGRTSRLDGSKGIDDLALLLARPGKEVAAVDLTGHVTAADSGDVLDGRARREIRARLEDLEEDLAEAEAHGDLARAEKARAERDALVTELAAAVGLGGRSRRLDDTRERARKAVTWRIRRAIRNIAGVDAALGRHLDQTVRTGTFCSYAPGTAVTWRVDAKVDPAAPRAAGGRNPTVAAGN